MTTILITGGAGSLGKALVNELQKREFYKLRVIDNNEHALASMKPSFCYQSEVRKFYGSVTDKDRVRRAVHGADIVIHCAAMKNIDITEYNASELIKTNIIGTDNVISSAVEAGVSKIMFISSDKAVEPSSIYGASKLIGEHTALNYNQTSSPASKVSVFRSGNFKDSNGNVFESWKSQIKNRLPLTITDLGCFRYFIDTSTAAEIIINCILKMEGGEIFIPDETVMKETSIIYLARKFYCDSMNPPIPDTELNTSGIKFTHTGLRKGEKLSEKLLSEYEKQRCKHDKRLRCLVIK